MTSILILPTFIQQFYVCDGEDAFLFSIVTLIPVSVNLASNSQNITLWERGRAELRRTEETIRKRGGGGGEEM